MLDNCIGGALNSGETPLTCLVREAHEEAALPEELLLSLPHCMRIASTSSLVQLEVLTPIPMAAADADGVDAGGTVLLVPKSVI